MVVVVVVVVVGGDGVAGSGSVGGFGVRRERGGVKTEGKGPLDSSVCRWPPKGNEREKERKLTE